MLPVGHIEFQIDSKFELDLCLYVPRNLQKCQINRSHTARVLSRKENPRWLPGSHIEFLISSKIKLDILLMYILIVLINFKAIAQTLLKILSRNKNQNGGHIGFPTCSKLELNLHLICINNPANFQSNSSNLPCDIEQKCKSKMASWRPYWISGQLQNRT